MTLTKFLNFYFGARKGKQALCGLTARDQAMVDRNSDLQPRMLGHRLGHGMTMSKYDTDSCGGQRMAATADLLAGSAADSLTKLGRASRLSRLGGWLLALMMMVTSATVFAAAPREGEFILNRAIVEYTDANTGQVLAVTTNQVRVLIDAKEGIDIDAGQTVTRSPGGDFCLSHQVINTGNDDSEVVFNIAQLTGANDNFDPTDLEVVIESDPANGVADPNEVRYSVVPGSSTPAVPVPYQGVINILVCGVVPPDQQNGDDALLELTATTVAQQATDSEIDNIQVVAGPDLQVSLQASTTNAQPGDIVTFTIDSQNLGDAPAAPLPYTVDGVSDDLVLLSFPIPANTTFDSLGDNLPAGVIPLYHRIGDPPGVYTTTPPPADEIDEVAFGVPDGFPAGQSYETPVRVRVDQGVTGQITGTAAAVSAGPNGGEVRNDTNTVRVTLPEAGNVVLENYSDDTYTTVQNSLNGAQPLFLQVNAPQCNNNANQVDPLVAGTYTIRIRSVIAGDIETINMVETGANTNIFRAVPNQVNTFEGPANLENGVVEVTAEDTLEATFEGGSECQVEGQIQITLVPGVSMFIDKGVTPTRSEVGGVVTYTITVRNTTSNVLNNVVISDRAAFGFQHIIGSATVTRVSQGDTVARIVPVDAINFADSDAQVVGGAGPNLQFFVGSLQPSGAIGGADQVTITYRSKLGPGSVRSDGINTAIARAQLEDLTGNVVANQALVVASTRAEAQVIVDAGVFTDRGYIIGKVYADCDFDRRQGHEEIGIPGVRIYLNDGTYVVTDSEGKYSFYGLEPKTWVAKLDNTTLPPGFQPKPLDNRHAGVGDSRFVDLFSGELHRADFADGGCFPEMIENVKARRAKGEIFAGEVEKNLDADLLRERGFANDVKARPSSGLVDAQRGIQVEELDVDAFLNDKNSTLPSEPLLPEPEVDLETLLKGGVSKEFGFIGIDNNAVLPRQKMSVMVKGRQQAQFRLSVNGIEVPKSRVGQVVTDPENGIQAWEFVSVAFRPGSNELKAEQVDQFGNVRSEAVVTVFVADQLADMVLRIPERPIADGSSVMVEVAITDQNGTAISARTPVTLEVDIGRWLAEDLDPSSPGVQVFVEGGISRFELAAPSKSLEMNIRATSGLVVAEAEIDFLPDLRPLIAVGLIEGTIGFNSNDGDGPRGNDSFQRELNNFDDEIDDEDYTAGLRGGLFMKGRVLSHYLLTARYDSEQDDEDTLFRDIQPDQFYPVYGDSSQRGFDAQSTSKVFVRVDRERNYLQYGDFSTSDGNSVLGLARYNRSMTGLKSHLETDSFALNLFVAEDDTRQITTEFRGRGISGPYEFASNPSEFVPNSEQVELVVRRRGQDAIVLDVQPLTRFTDYQIDRDRGEILFRGPVQSLDEELNPIFIRVTYEVERGGEEYITAGGSFEWAVTDNFAVSGTYVKDDNPDGELTVQGGGVEFRPFSNTTIMLEHANTIRPDANGDDINGEANRAEIRFNEGPVSANLYAAKSDATYSTASGSNNLTANTGTLAGGREEYGLDMTVRLTDSTNLRLDAYRTEDRTANGNDEREHAEVAISQRFGEYLTVELNAGQTEGTTADGREIDDRTIGGRLTTKVPYIDNSSLFAEYRKDIRDTDQSSLVLGAEIPVDQRTRVYARHEIKNTLDSGREGFTGENETNQTVFGISTSYMENQGSLFSEYRARDAFGGRSTEAAIGVRHGWEITDGFNLNAAFEQVRTLDVPDGQIEQDAMSLALSADYTANPLWKLTGRLEWRQSKSRRSWLGTFGVGRKLSRDWTFLGRNSLTIDEDRESGDRTLRDRLQLGLAWRETDRNRWSVLARYELEYEKLENSADSNAERLALNHIVSAHVNFKPTEGLITSGRYAYKFSGEEIGDSTFDFDTHLVSARVTYDFAERWDAGVATSALFNEDAVHYGAGLEVGYLLGANLWLSAGYNFFGYDDSEQLSADYTSEGSYIRFRYKFDETLFSGGDPYVNNTMPAAAGVFEQVLTDAQ